MPQPIEEGMVLGGRYLVTGHVLTSADQDMVLDGRDQVLNRDVSILVASPAHASQVAASARELATGERHGSVQVLDLGLSEGHTYLIAGGAPRPEELLDMVREQQVYVEPFHTDTLGSEIFGEARTYEPHVYEDDEEYYEELDDGFVEEDAKQRRPRFLKNISERLSQRLGTDAARDAVAGAAGAGAVGAAAGTAAGRPGEDEPTDDDATAAGRRPEPPLPDTVSDDDWTGVQDEVTLDPQGRATSQQGQRPASQQGDRPGPQAGTGSQAGRPSRDEEATQAVAATPAGGADRPQGAPVRADRGMSGTGSGEGHDGARPGGRGTGSATGRLDVRDSSAEDTGEVPRPGAGAATAGTARGTAHGTAGNAGVAGPAGPAPSRSPKVSLWSDDEDDRRTHGSAAPAAAAGAAVAGAAAASTGRSGQAGKGGLGTETTTHAGSPERHAGTHAGSAALTEDSGEDAYPDAEDRDDEYQQDDRPRGARWILGGILVLLLVLGAVFAFNLLGNNRAPVADDPASTSPSSGSATSGSPSESPSSDLPEPVIAGATRLVPDDQSLSAETDTTLPNAYDGNPATAWQTYSFAQPAFGGFASSMALVVELEEESAISQVDITQNNGSGGSFSVLLNDSPDLEGAQQIAEGSFTGPQVSVPVNGDDGAPASARYVILNFTELPQLSNASANLPYGLRIAEVEVR